MKLIAETERLLIREWDASDAKDIFMLNEDPEVVRYTGDRAFVNVKEALSLILNYDQYRQYGIGRWAVLDKSSGDFLGWSGLKRNGDGVVDLGFRFFRKHWGGGFATEAALACLDYGFSKKGISGIVGRAMSENIASVRVLEKVGMSFVKEFDFDGQLGVEYCLAKRDFEFGK
ncbi:N-acetyltransferase [Fulvitalea axinellae]|uniref:N-acetyltransferase n=1 Tax=Fulvitalea axinellae TaxID=1182444 RepID=A0AAU9CU24_9BACT|nr:N-acetyltransferase [Fulvitalea axinellae]